MHDGWPSANPACVDHGRAGPVRHAHRTRQGKARAVQLPCFLWRSEVSGTCAYILGVCLVVAVL